LTLTDVRHCDCGDLTRVIGTFDSFHDAKVALRRELDRHYLTKYGVYEACHVGRECHRERDIAALRAGAPRSERAFDWSRCWGGWNGNTWNEEWSAGTDCARVAITEEGSGCGSSDMVWTIAPTSITTNRAAALQKDLMQRL
jgi:hypothetical protein